MLCCKFSEQRLRLLQIARVEPFREPAVDRSKQFARLLRLTLVAPEAREAHGCAEFPGFCLLHSRDRQCTYLGMTFLMRTTAPLGQYIACGSLIIGCDSSVASSGTPSIATIDCACEGIISTAICFRALKNVRVIEAQHAPMTGGMDFSAHGVSTRYNSGIKAVDTLLR